MSVIRIRNIAILLFILCLLVVPVWGLSLNFQDASDAAQTITLTNNGGGRSSYTTWQDGGADNRYMVSYAFTACGGYPEAYILNPTPYMMTYSAATLLYISGDYNGNDMNPGQIEPPRRRPGIKVRFYDVNGAEQGTYLWVWDSGSSAGSRHERYEVKVLGGTAILYRDGVEVTRQSSPMSVNPHYIGWSALAGGFSSYDCYGTGNVYLDNMIWAESDYHIIGTIPSNWSVQRDLLNQAATGVYAFNPNTNLWVVKNSQYIYLDADKGTSDSESLYIKNLATGAVVNTTLQSDYRNIVTMPISNFLNMATIADGQYSIGFANSAKLEYFWVMSNGASISYDKATYNLDDTAILSYTISPSYYQTSTYDYSYKLVDIYGATKGSGLIDQSGTVNVVLSDATYDPGVLYAEIIATKKSDHTESIMAFNAATLQEYMIFQGYVLDAETTAPISLANISVTQAALYSNVLSGVNGNYTTTGTFLTGGALTINATKSGYKRYNYTFTPRLSKRININITLQSLNTTSVGLAVNGVAREALYGRPIENVSVSATNATTGENYYAKTNIAGYYVIDERVSAFLNPNRIYAVTGTKVGYTSPIYQKQMIAI